MHWSSANQLDSILQVDDLCKNLTILVVRCTVDSLVTETDVTMLASLISKFHKLEHLDIGKFSAIISSSSRSTKTIFVPNSIVLMGRNYQKSFSSLCLLPAKLLHIVGILREIKLLNLSGNNIILEAATMLSTAISSFTGLGVLLMEDCGLQTEALQVITKSLSSSKLYTMDLSFNDITSETAITCTDITDTISNLNNLYLDGNSLKSLKETNFIVMFSTLTDLSIDSEILPDVKYVFNIVAVN